MIELIQPFLVVSCSLYNCFILLHRWYPGQSRRERLVLHWWTRTRCLSVSCSALREVFLHAGTKLEILASDFSLGIQSKSSLVIFVNSSLSTLVVVPVCSRFLKLMKPPCKRSPCKRYSLLGLGYPSLGHMVGSVDCGSLQVAECQHLWRSNLDECHRLSGPDLRFAVGCFSMLFDAFRNILEFYNVSAIIRLYMCARSASGAHQSFQFSGSGLSIQGLGRSERHSGAAKLQILQLSTHQAEKDGGWRRGSEGVAWCI